MKRAEKEVFLSELSRHVGETELMALLSFEKLSVEKMTDFRLSLKRQGFSVKVVKNTLAKRAFGCTSHGDLLDKFVGPTLMVFGSNDPVTYAKAVCEWIGKENLNFKVKGAVALGEVVSADRLLALSKLPGKNELFVGFLWALKSGPTKVLYALQDAPRKLAYALTALKEKKEKGAS